MGVAVGTCALAFSLAVGLGLRAFIDKEFQGREDFWRVLVRVDEPPPDEQSAGKGPRQDRSEGEHVRRAAPASAKRSSTATLTTPPQPPRS